MATITPVENYAHPVQPMVSDRSRRFTKAPAIVAYFNTADEAIEGAKRIATGVKPRKGQHTFWYVNTRRNAYYCDFVANSHGEVASHN